MTQLAAHHLQHRIFLFRVGGEVHVTPLTRQAQPRLTGLHQVGNAKAGPCAIDGDGLARYRSRAPELDAIALAEHGHRHGDGSEIVDHLQACQAEVGLHLADGELPAVVGHGDPVTIDGTGDGDARLAHGGIVLFEIEAHHGLQAGMGQPRIGFCLGNGARRQFAEGQPGIGTANVAHQRMGMLHNKLLRYRLGAALTVPTLLFGCNTTRARSRAARFMQTSVRPLTVLLLCNICKRFQDANGSLQLKTRNN